MAEEASGTNVMLGKGKVYFDRLDSSGDSTGERFLGNCTTFELSTSDELRDMYSSAEQSSPLLKSVNVRRTQEFNITLNEFTQENMALALMGDVSALAQGASSVTDEVKTYVSQGVYYQTTYRNISAVVVEPSGGGAAWVLNTDYTVDATTGRIYVIVGGGIVADFQVDYTYGADTSVTVRSGVDNLIEGFIRFIGDPAAGPVWECEIWKVSISPEGAVGFISDDYAEFTLKGKVLADSTNHADEPYFRLIKRAA